MKRLTGKTEFTKPEEIITDEMINNVWGNANFGEELNKNKRNVVDNALLKIACGYSNGYTAHSIIEELGLVNTNKELTKLGRKYLYESFTKENR